MHLAAYAKIAMNVQVELLKVKPSQGIAARIALRARRRRARHDASGGATKWSHHRSFFTSGRRGLSRGGTQPLAHRCVVDSKSAWTRPAVLGRAVIAIQLDRDAGNQIGPLSFGKHTVGCVEGGNWIHRWRALKVIDQVERPMCQESARERVVPKRSRRIVQQ